MARSKNNLSGLTKYLSQTKAGAKSTASTLPVTNLVAQTHGSGTEKAASLGLAGGISRTSMNAKVTPLGIRFGGHVSSGTKSSSSSGSEWGNLLKQTASGGIASAFSGSFGGIGGLGSLISGIVSLFGGGGTNTPSPLVNFHLPSSQQQTVYISATGSNVYQGSAVEAIGGGSSTKDGIYANSLPATSGGSPSSEQVMQEQSAQIAQAVKIALLNSSSLNDVIAEI